MLIDVVLLEAHVTKGLLIKLKALCLNDGKPYREGAGTSKLMPGNEGSNGTSPDNIKNTVTQGLLGAARNSQRAFVVSASTSYMAFAANH